MAAKQKGETLETSTFSSSSGPISVSVRSIPDPVVITGTDETVTLEITVENTGGGELRLLGVFYPSGSPAVRYEVNRP